MFAGIGSQYQALKNIGANVEHHKIVEWQVNSIQAYNDIHIGDTTDYAQGKTKEELVSFLLAKGVSIDYNKPVEEKQLQRKPIEWLSRVYNNIVATKNLVNIMNVRGSDLEIKETDKYEYILTYSFPCQDLSLAGKGNGMTKGGGTRSGLLWEIERILNEIKTSGGELPQVLLMENVPEAVGSKNWGDFSLWEEYLTSLGYFNYYKIMNAKDFGIPQNRERVFMVSILGSYTYEFPKEQPLTLRLKDMLEAKVDEKYYLSEKLFSFFVENHKKNKEKGNGFAFKPTDGESVAKCIMTLSGDRMDDNFIADTKEYANYITWLDDKGRINTQDHRAYFEDRLSGVVPAMERGVPNVINKELRIRKLTPRECYRLMGFSDEAFDKAQANQSNSALYHQAGDSIVVNVLMAIFKEML
jgi:DNA (cytosine-5)-methyltransferase 1